MTRLIVARHGNTFEQGEPPRRVGGRTDLPLTEKGRNQAQILGKFLKEKGLLPDAVCAGPLSRTQDTARIALTALEMNIEIQIFDFLREIDHGPDENQPESDVLARLGPEALADWEEHSIPPSGWQVDVDRQIAKWQNFAQTITARYPHGTVLTVTSNGMARFALHLTGDYETARRTFGAKLATGALGILDYKNDAWLVTAWNLRPEQPA